jgi:hypothetical protein
MSNVIVNHSAAEINGQHQTNQDQATALLSKLSALLEIGLSSDLQTQTTASLHDYLWVLSDLVLQLKSIVD